MVISVAVMVIPNALKVGAEAAVASVYDDCEGGVFTLPLSADGQEPATHWGASPIVADSVMQSIEAMAGQEPFASVAHLRTCEPVEAAATFHGLRAELGLQIVEVIDE